MPDKPSALSAIFAALRPPQPETPPQWQEAPQPLGDRLRAFEERRAATETGNLTHAAGRAGEQARRALEALLEDPRSAVLAQIRQAAAADPAGMAGVIAGMQPGGKYAGLRATFDSVRVQERAFASAYEHAVGSIGRYGEARMRLGEHFAVRRMDAGALDRQFGELDREIVQAAQALPGRKPGGSVETDLMAKVRTLAKFFADVVASGVVTAAHVLSATKPSTPGPRPAVRPF